MNHFMNWDKAVDRGNFTTLKVGAQLIGANGVGYEVTDVVVTNMHRLGGTASPEVLVTYRWDDNGRKGSETVSIHNFYNNIHS